MRNVAIIALALLLGRCATKKSWSEDVPRALPVKSVAKELHSTIDRAAVAADKAKDMSARAVEKGLVANSDEAKELHDTVKTVTTELDNAKAKVIVVEDRAEALEKERDVFANKSNEQVKDLKNLTTQNAVLEDRRKFWMHFSWVTGGIILILILLKLAKIYGISTNPLFYLSKLREQ